jgi:hypothetical protein
MKGGDEDADGDIVLEEGHGVGASEDAENVEAENGGWKRNLRHPEPISYHPTAIMHLQSSLSQCKGGPEKLKAVSLLYRYALLWPVSPRL